MLKSRPFQFSLREMLLTITAIGACLALMLQNVRNWIPFRGTVLAYEFSLQDAVNRIASQHGVSPHASGSGGSGRGSGPHGCESRASYGFRIPKKDRLAVFDSLKREVEAILKDSGCTLDGGGSGPMSFHWRYRTGSLCGVVKVDMDDISDFPEFTQISYYVAEFKK